MHYLGTAADGRDNNLNLIRMAAATAVLVSHAWPITQGAGVSEPLTGLTGHSLGTLAVYVFFAISGFLIAASFTRSSSIRRFVAARVLRLMPGLAVSLLLVAFVMGPLVTTLPLSAYFADPSTWTFLARNITLYAPQYTLPGVFETNPYTTVEGSIWTLVHEVACYGLVFLAGVAGLLRPGWRMWLVVALYAASWVLAGLATGHVPGRLLQFQGLSLPFMLGMAAWVWRDRIPLSGWAALGLFALALVGQDTPVAYPALIVAISYGTAWLAYVPKDWIRGYNRVGDYSYGMYIYAFPLQGAVVWGVGATGILAHVVLAFALTLGISVLSWHLIEKPALNLMRNGRHRAITAPTRALPSFGTGRPLRSTGYGAKPAGTKGSSAPARGV